jgi:DNA-binding protein
MGFLKKMFFCKRRRNEAAATRDIATTTDNLTSETGTQVSPIEMMMCDAGTQVDPNLTREASTQTINLIEKPETKTDGGATDKEKEELQNEVAALEKLLEEKDLHIRKLKVTTHELKERQRSEIHYIKTREEMEKSSLLRKIRDMRNEIISLKERRPRSTERDTEDTK